MTKNERLQVETLLLDIVDAIEKDTEPKCELYEKYKNELPRKLEGREETLKDACVSLISYWKKYADPECRPEIRGMDRKNWYLDILDSGEKYLLKNESKRHNPIE